jgi:hypothetical protein
MSDSHSTGELRLTVARPYGSPLKRRVRALGHGCARFWRLVRPFQPDRVLSCDASSAPGARECRLEACCIQSPIMA